MASEIIKPTADEIATARGRFRNWHAEEAREQATAFIGHAPRLYVRDMSSKRATSRHTLRVFAVRGGLINDVTYTAGVLLGSRYDFGNGGGIILSGMQMDMRADIVRRISHAAGVEFVYDNTLD